MLRIVFVRESNILCEHIFSFLFVFFALMYIRREKVLLSSSISCRFYQKTEFVRYRKKKEKYSQNLRNETRYFGYYF